ncbi:colicin immunity protein Cui [Proteus mirabilis]|uniref:colicin immunity protein Cui n=1 Tax=Proteus mirabilis TaxID=584 RepID=UPI0039F571B2
MNNIPSTYSSTYPIISKLSFFYCKLSPLIVLLFFIFCYKKLTLVKPIPINKLIINVIFPCLVITIISLYVYIFTILIYQIVVGVYLKLYPVINTYYLVTI